jgi:hypothetical protein
MVGDHMGILGAVVFISLSSPLFFLLRSPAPVPFKNRSPSGPSDSPKAASLVPDGDSAGPWSLKLASGLRSERFNPPPIGSSGTGRQVSSNGAPETQPPTPPATPKDTLPPGGRGRAGGEGVLGEHRGDRATPFSTLPTRGVACPPAQLPAGVALECASRHVRAGRYGLPAVDVTRFRLLLDCRSQLPIFFAHPSPTRAMPN